MVTPKTEKTKKKKKWQIRFQIDVQEEFNFAVKLPNPHLSDPAAKDLLSNRPGGENRRSSTWKILGTRAEFIKRRSQRADIESSYLIAR